MPDKTLPKPLRAEDVLTAIAVRYPSGSTVTLEAIVVAAGVSHGAAFQVRQWAKASGRWPYSDGRPGWTVKDRRRR